MPRWLALALRILSLWLFVSITFLILKLGFNYVFRGFLDLRKVAILEYVLLPVGLTFVYGFAIWFENRRARRARPLDRG